MKQTAGKLLLANGLTPSHPAHTKREPPDSVNKVTMTQPINRVEPINDKWLQIIGTPVAVLPFVFFYMNEYGYDWRLFAQAFLWGLVSTACAWQLLRWWVMKVRVRYADRTQFRQRILTTFLGYSLLIIPVQPIETWVVSHLDLTGMVTPAEFPRVYLIHIGMALLFALLVGAIYESMYYLQKNREAITEAEALKKATLQSQYDTLKNQVNPHFLFNSLNSLSSLITEDKKQAGAFLDELASVYRYLLQEGERELTSLRSEVEFIRSYLFLIETRFGPAISYDIRVEDRFLDDMLPPLTLQTLVENAIRYNVILPEKPLRLTIETLEDGQLLVSNPIQRKPLRVTAIPIGLGTLTDRFRRLGLPALEIKDDGEEFRVRVPLLRR
ncbi:sensor histidine kinase [Larkinella punicea]|uniref:sensor histidine kinase n=1 Tax=Larkinella punicea TaxID=2315727 RepID=UPI001058FD4A|nr:histidine kinase [Larkinella punicea]